MARQKTSPVEDIMTVTSMLPWWVGLPLALVSYLALHAVASQPPATVTSPGQLGNFAIKQFITTMAMFGQVILPIAFCFGALVSAITTSRQKKLFDNVASSTGGSAVNDMGWEDFERLISEYFRRSGYQVTREGGNGPDGGIDLVLQQKGETYLVQCKHWKAYKVGVQPVREFYGVMASRGAAGGFLVTSGAFTDEARNFAQGLNIYMINGTKLRSMITASNNSVSSRTAAVSRPMAASPTCPKCGGEMVKRVARQGANAGKEFWGCVTYPKCHGTRDLAQPVS